MKKNFFISIMILFLIIPAHAETTLVFSQINNILDQNVGAEILKIAYSKIGISIQIVDMPGKRSLKESSEGRVDGEVNRIFNIGETYPELIRVPTPINYIEPSVFSNNFNFNVTDCDGLKNHTIGIVRGTKYAELCTKEMKHVQVVNNLEKALNMLNYNRVDLVITAKQNGLYLAKKMDLKSIYLLSPPLTKMPLYHYLNRKHKDLVGKIDKVLFEMQENGELAMLRKKYLSSN